MGCAAPKSKHVVAEPITCASPKDVISPKQVTSGIATVKAPTRTEAWATVMVQESSLKKTSSLTGEDKPAVSSTSKPVAPPPHASISDSKNNGPAQAARRSVPDFAVSKPRSAAERAASAKMPGAIVIVSGSSNKLLGRTASQLNTPTSSTTPRSCLGRNTTSETGASLSIHPGASSSLSTAASIHLEAAVATNHNIDSSSGLSAPSSTNESQPAPHRGSGGSKKLDEKINSFENNCGPSAEVESQLAKRKSFDDSATGLSARGSTNDSPAAPQRGSGGSKQPDEKRNSFNNNCGPSAEVESQLAKRKSFDDSATGLSAPSSTKESPPAPQLRSGGSSQLLKRSNSFNGNSGPLAEEKSQPPRRKSFDDAKCTQTKRASQEVAVEREEKCSKPMLGRRRSLGSLMATSDHSKHTQATSPSPELQVESEAEGTKPMLGRRRSMGNLVAASDLSKFTQATKASPEPQVETEAEGTKTVLGRRRSMGNMVATSGFTIKVEKASAQKFRSQPPAYEQEEETQKAPNNLGRRRSVESQMATLGSGIKAPVGQRASSERPALGRRRSAAAQMGGNDILGVIC